MSTSVMDIKTEIKTEPTDVSTSGFFDEKPNVKFENDMEIKCESIDISTPVFFEEKPNVKFENDVEIKSESIDDSEVEIHDDEILDSKNNIFNSPPFVSCGNVNKSEEDEEVKNEDYNDTMTLNSSFIINYKDIDTAQRSVKKTNSARCVCFTCNKSFYDRRTFLEHRNIHRGIRPFVCNLCQKTYTHRSTLRTHKLSHSGKRSYVCDVCQKSFVTSKNLKSHTKLHEEVKRCICIGCNKLFKNAKNLRTHVSRICPKLYERMQNSTKSGERPYVCEHCKTSFSDADCLNMHKFVRRH